MIDFDQEHLLALENQRQSAGARAKQAGYLALLKPVPGERILDLGSGSGALARALAALVQAEGHVTGVDLAPEAVALATRLSAGLAPDLLTFIQADGHALPMPDGRFDAATCVSVLAFCDDPGRVLAELRRVLRPGGRLLVANSDEDTRVYYSHDRELGRRVLRAIADRARDPWLSRRLLGLLRQAGFRLLHENITTTVEREFQPGTSGHALAHAWRDYLIHTAGIAPRDYERWLADLAGRGADGTYCYSVTTYTYLGER